MGAGKASAGLLKLLLLDEMLDPEIAIQLRKRRRDVESIQGDRPELLGLDDEAVLHRAKQLGRTLVTDNVRHFLPLHRQYLAEQKTHSGLLLAHPRAYPRSKKTIGIWVRGLERALKSLGSSSTENLCEWLE